MNHLRGRHIHNVHIKGQVNLLACVRIDHLQRHLHHLESTRVTRPVGVDGPCCAIARYHADAVAVNVMHRECADAELADVELLGLVNLTFQCDAELAQALQRSGGVTRARTSRKPTYTIFEGKRDGLNHSHPSRCRVSTIPSKNANVIPAFKSTSKRCAQGRADQGRVCFRQ